MHSCVRTYIHACMRACMHVYIRTYLPTYLPAYLPTYIHTYIPKKLWDMTRPDMTLYYAMTWYDMDTI